jgi:hypothetical protein
MIKKSAGCNAHIVPDGDRIDETGVIKICSIS